MHPGLVLRVHCAKDLLIYFKFIWIKVIIVTNNGKRIHKDLRDFGRGFARIRETLGEDSQGLK